MRWWIVLFVSVGLVVAPSTHTARAQDRDRKETGQEAPVVYTNEDLPPAPVGTQATATARPAPPEPLAVSASHDAVRDRSGHGEGWWRQRAAELEARVVAAR